ncbi:MAG: hypothetical protein AAGG68_26850 [Bacteroidota bacterium]
MKKLNTILVLLLLFISFCTSNAQEIRLRVGGEYVSTFDEDFYESDFESFSILERTDSFSVIQRYDYSVIYQNKYQPEYSFSGGADILWQLNDKWKLESGIQFRHWQFDTKDEFVSSRRRATGIDTIPTISRPTSRFACNFTNSYQDVNPRDGALYTLTELQLPIRFNYEFLPKKLDISTGIKLITPIHYKRYREYASIHRDDSTNPNTCTYQLREEELTSNISIGNLNFSYDFRINYWLTNKIGLSASAEQLLGNVFSKDQDSYSIDRNYRPIFLGIGAQYRIHSPYKSVRDPLVFEDYQDISEIKEALKEQKEYEENRFRLTDLRLRPNFSQFYLEGGFGLGLSTNFPEDLGILGSVGLRYEFRKSWSTSITYEQGLKGLDNSYGYWNFNRDLLNWTPRFGTDGNLAHSVSQGSTNLGNDRLQISGYNDILDASSLQFSLFYHPSIKNKSNSKLWFGLGLGRYFSKNRAITYFHSDGTFSYGASRNNKYNDIDWRGNLQLGYSFGRFRQLFQIQAINASLFKGIIDWGEIPIYLSLSNSYMLPLKKGSIKNKKKEVSKEITNNRKRILLGIGWGMATPYYKSSIGSQKLFATAKYRLNDQYAIGVRAEVAYNLRGINIGALSSNEIQLFDHCPPYEPIISFNRYSDLTKGEKNSSFHLLAERYYWKRSYAFIIGASAGISEVWRSNYRMNPTTEVYYHPTANNNSPFNIPNYRCSEEDFRDSRHHFRYDFPFVPSLSLRTGFTFSRIRTMLHYDYVHSSPDLIGLEMSYELFGGKKKKR